MNYEDKITIPTKIVKYPSWAWVPGMRISHISRPYRVVQADICDYLCEDYWDLLVVSEDDRIVSRIIPSDETFPDLDDPATFGSVMSLTRELWSKKQVLHGSPPVLCITECDGKWEVGYRYGEVSVVCFYADTEIRALSWALENGP